MATAVCALMLALPVTLLAACSGTELKPFSQYSEYAVKAAVSYTHLTLPTICSV